MNKPTATLVRSLVRLGKGALAAVEKWVDEVEDKDYHAETRLQSSQHTTSPQ